MYFDPIGGSALFPVRRDSCCSMITNSLSPPVRTDRQGQRVITGLWGFGWVGICVGVDRVILAWWILYCSLVKLRGLGSKTRGQLGGSLSFPPSPGRWEPERVCLGNPLFSFWRLWLQLPTGAGIPAVSHKTPSSLKSPVKAWAPIKFARLGLGHETHAFLHSLRTL